VISIVSHAMMRVDRNATELSEFVCYLYTRLLRDTYHRHMFVETVTLGTNNEDGFL